LRTFISLLILIAPTASLVWAQTTDDLKLEAHVGSATALFKVPLDLLRLEHDSLACSISWDPSYESGRMGDAGILAKAHRSQADTGVLAVTFMRVPAGSIDVIQEVPEPALRARIEGRYLVLELGASAALNTLQGWHPDSLYFETPPWGFSAALRTWVRPIYAP
jgi:hypothetical protein